MKNLYLLIFAVLFGIPSSAWSAFVVIQLWQWFVAPTFGVPAPNLWVVAGLVVLVRYVTATIGAKTAYDDIEEPLGKVGYIVFVSTFWPALALLNGYIFHILAIMGAL